MILRMVRAQRPHLALQPWQPYTWPAVRALAVFTALRTSWSVKTLQEQTIISNPAMRLASPWLTCWPANRKMGIW